MIYLDPIVVAGAVGVVGSLIAATFSRVFCAEPAPRALREFREIWFALLFVRALIGRLTDIPPGSWTDIIWTGAALATLAIAFWNMRRGFVSGDRCGPARPDGSRVISESQ